MGDVKIVFHWHLESSDILISCFMSCGALGLPHKCLSAKFCISMFLLSSYLFTSTAFHHAIYCVLKYSPYCLLLSTDPECLFIQLYFFHSYLPSWFEVEKVAWLPCLSFSWCPNRILLSAKSLASWNVLQFHKVEILYLRIGKWKLMFDSKGSELKDGFLDFNGPIPYKHLGRQEWPFF